MPDEMITLERTRDTRERAEIELAVAALHPERFGLRRHRDGWRKTIPGLGDVVFAPLGWQHAQCASYDFLELEGAREPLDVLRFLVRLQARVWGMPPEELVPVNILAILPDTGGSVLVAYREELGFNADGWLGFAIAAGGRSGTLVSHMLGVREEQRGSRDLGWHLKLLQGYEALRAGHRSAVWTFDPMRGAHARLNIEKLGATVRELTPDNAERLAKTAPAAACYQIPADIDALMTEDPRRANDWRSEMRTALSPFMTIKSARAAAADAPPIEIGVDLRPGAYDVVAFATNVRAPGDRDNWYILRRRGGEA